MAVRTQWNDAEDEALRACTWMARLVYLQAIRRAMDYETGVAGRATVISYQRIAEILDCTTHTTSPDQAPTKRMIQRSFESLERAGLVRWIKPTGPQRGVVFECLLADTHQSVKKQAVPKRYPSGTQAVVPEEASNGAGSGKEAVPDYVAVQHAQAVPPQKSGIQDIDGYRERGATTPKPTPTARGARLTLSSLPDTFRAWCKSNRPDLDPDATWDAFRDYWIAQPGQKGVKADWLATWRNWCRREKPRHNGKPYSHESKAERIAASNRAAGDEFVSSDRIIDSTCRRA